MAVLPELNIRLSGNLPQETAREIDRRLKHDHGIHKVVFSPEAENLGLNPRFSLVDEDGKVKITYPEDDGSIYEAEIDQDSIAYEISRFVIANCALEQEDQTSRQNYLSELVTNPVRPPIEVDPSVWIATNEFVFHLTRMYPEYGNMVRFLCNERGLFYKPGNYRSQRAYWNSLTNGGLPIQKKSNPIHEGTFMLHDLFHFVPLDPMPNSDNDPGLESAYVAHRMMSEASTLVLADMVAVGRYLGGDRKFDTTKRKIFPVYESMVDSPEGEPSADKLITANIYFALTGDTEGFLRLGASQESLKDYKDKYSPVFSLDYLWNMGNFSSLTELIQNSSAYGEYFEWLEQQELPQPARNYLSSMTANGEIDLSTMASMFRGDFRIASSYSLPINERLRSRRAFLKYYAGQRAVFAALSGPKEDPSFLRDFDELYLSADPSAELTELASELDELIRRYIETKDLLPHEVANYQYAFPIYPIRYVNYEKDESPIQSGEFQTENKDQLQRLLNSI